MRTVLAAADSIGIRLHLSVPRLGTFKSDEMFLSVNKKFSPLNIKSQEEFQKLHKVFLVLSSTTLGDLDNWEPNKFSPIIRLKVTTWLALGVKLKGLLHMVLTF